MPHVTDSDVLGSHSDTHQAQNREDDDDENQTGGPAGIGSGQTTDESRNIALFRLVARSDTPPFHTTERTLAPTADLTISPLRTAMLDSREDVRPWVCSVPPCR
ncbi:unannotated protein [freshwater metagenome]|uniref:Unannotated protein n=1 Tax=freshwater metagenome TaxID=449393 RepID=A0A6J7EPG9_9ZZZZ